MRTKQIIKEIKSFPVAERIFIAEKIIHSIRIQETKTEMEMAADLLFSDYNLDDELTIFSDLDFEDFYETK